MITITYGMLSGITKLTHAFDDLNVTLGDALSVWEHVTWEPNYKAERLAKQARRQRRHAFMSHGKHGMKRPKHK